MLFFSFDIVLGSAVEKEFVGFAGMKQQTNHLSAINVSRRNFLSGQLRAADPIRPPWATVSSSFTRLCSRCDACIDHCPETILRRGDGGFPEVDFSRGECTFCEKCLEVCRDLALVRMPGRSPWALKAEIGNRCIVLEGVVCRSCLEQCEPAAIRLHYEGGRMAKPRLSLERCTGCGACVRPCPVGAVRVAAMTDPSREQRI